MPSRFVWTIDRARIKRRRSLVLCSRSCVFALPEAALRLGSVVDTTAAVLVVEDAVELLGQELVGCEVGRVGAVQQERRLCIPGGKGNGARGVHS